MTVLACSGTGCDRLISVSRQPGGNRVALDDPEGWATKFTICSACHRYYCDRCTGPRCEGCGGELVDGSTFLEVSGARPDPPAEAYRRGVALAEEGRYEEAVAAFEEAARRHDGYADAHYRLGLSLLRLGREDEAVRALERAGNADAHRELGAAHRLAGRPAEAARALDRAIAAAPGHLGAAVEKAAALIDLDRPAEALTVIERAIDQGRERHEETAWLAFAYQVKGVALLHLRRNDDALAALDIALAAGRDDAGCYRDRAIALRRLGRHHEADLSDQISRRLAGPSTGDDR